MPPKKAVKQPARQLTRTAPPTRRRAVGAAGTLDLAEEQADAVAAADEGTEAPVARPAAPRPAPAARPVPAARSAPARWR
jgi:hypothetical protein